MKKITFNLIAITFFVFQMFSLSAQLTLNLIPVSESSNVNVDICDHVTLDLNENANFNEANCIYFTDFDNVQPGINKISVNSDLDVDEEVSIFDLVLFHQFIDNGFPSYAQAMAADMDSDKIISTDDMVLMIRVILYKEFELPTKFKIGSSDYLTDPMIGLELLSDHTSYTFEDTNVQDGEVKELILVTVGNLELE